MSMCQTHPLERPLHTIKVLEGFAIVASDIGLGERKVIHNLNGESKCCSIRRRRGGWSLLTELTTINPI